MSHTRRISSLPHAEAAGGGLVLVVFTPKVTKGSLERQGRVGGSKNFPVTSVVEVWSFHRRNWKGWRDLEDADMIKDTQSSRVGFQLILWKFIWPLGRIPKSQALCALCWASFPLPAALRASLALCQGCAESILLSGHLWMGTKPREEG